MAVTGKDFLVKKGNRGRTPRSYDQGCNYLDGEEGGMDSWSTQKQELVKKKIIQ